jgi:DNA-binding transcriptional LysR family regulator
MDLLLIRSFLAVSDAGAITDASANINITQPALSRRIKQLESSLGAELLIRGRKGVELTEIGRRVEQEGRLLVTRYDQLRAEVSRMQGLSGGTVRIGGGATAVSFVLPEAIAQFQSEHPEIHFQLKEAGSSEVARNVIDGALELGVVTMPVASREFDVQPLMSDQIVLVARNDHILVQRNNVVIEDLAGLSFVGFEAGSAIRKIIDNVLRDAAVEMNVVMELRSIPAILRMVATTGNLAFVSRLGLKGQLDVREIEVHKLGMARQLAIISKKGGRLSPAAQAFADVLSSMDSVTQD